MMGCTFILILVYSRDELDIKLAYRISGHRIFGRIKDTILPDTRIFSEQYVFCIALKNPAKPDIWPDTSLKKNPVIQSIYP